MPITEISENLQNAYIAQEDKRFYKHHGVDFIGLARRVWLWLQNRERLPRGGSTGTQQVIKSRI